MLSLQIFIDVVILLYITPTIARKKFLIVKRSGLIGFAQILHLLIKDPTIWKDGFKKGTIKKRKGRNK